MGASQLGKFEPTPRYRAPLPGGEIFEKSPPGRGRGGLSEVIAKVRCTLISFALEELIRTRKKRNLLDLSGQIQFSTDYDYKALRTNRNVSD